MVIRRTDRLADVLGRDERLLDVLLAVSPALHGLRNPVVRRTMGRLTTVEKAARMAGLDPDYLVERLNRATAAGRKLTAAEEPPTPELRSGEEQGMPTVDTALPPALVRIPADRVVDLDVREDLRNGREPFSRIMAAVRAVPPGGALRLRAIFEPVPLYAVMAKQGFDHWTVKLSDDDWRVWFHPAASSGAERRGDRPPTAASRRPETGKDEEVIVLDVRGMEPPEPMVRTLAALEELPPGGTLVQVNERVPQFLLPRLEEQGFRYEIRKQDDALVRVFIRRRGDP